MMDVEIEYRRPAAPTFPLMRRLWVERGSKADWDALHHLHYKAESLPIGPKFWRCVDEDGNLIGIVVTAVVSLMSRARHELMPKLSPSSWDSNQTNRARALWLNQNMRRDARIVVDTLYRGVGVAYRMVNLVNRMEGVRFIEIQSSMSKFNPFDVKAGFRHGHLRVGAAYKKGIQFFRENFESHPADHQAIMEEFESLPEPLRNKLGQRIADFYYENSAKEQTGMALRAGNGRVMAMSVSKIVKEIQHLTFATPVYGIWENPDCGRELPERLPLIAYDLQKPTEPLRLERLEGVK